MSIIQDLENRVTKLEDKFEMLAKPAAKPSKRKPSVSYYPKKFNADQEAVLDAAYGDLVLDGTESLTGVWKAALKVDKEVLGGQAFARFKGQRAPVESVRNWILAKVGIRVIWSSGGPYEGVK